MNRWIIIGAGEQPPRDQILPLLQPNDRILCADGGYVLCQSLGLVPEKVIGDMDSLKEPLPDSIPVLAYPPNKDETDSRLAAAYAMEQGADELLFIGVLGGRLDHTLASFQTLSWCSIQGIRAELVGTDVHVYAVTCGKIRLEPVEDAYFSIFALGNEVQGVTIRGGAYSLDSAVLSPYYPLGISNEFTGVPVDISATRGTLIIIVQKKHRPDGNPI